MVIERPRTRTGVDVWSADTEKRPRRDARPETRAYIYVFRRDSRMHELNLSKHALRAPLLFLSFIRTSAARVCRAPRLLARVVGHRLRHRAFSRKMRLCASSLVPLLLLLLDAHLGASADELVRTADGRLVTIAAKVRHTFQRFDADNNGFLTHQV